ncbi:MAG: energy transducer TonB [Bacteroidales bacterium]|nr:energy transducer TonB [Bacteroidales bacterium]
MAFKHYLPLLCLFLGPLAIGQPKELTVKEFLKLSTKDTTSYVVSGVVTKTGSSSRGSFYLKDRTGTLYVYGIKDPADASRSFRQMDIVPGDTVSVLGRFTIYNETTKEMKDGRLLSKSNGPDHDKPFAERVDKKESFKGKEGDDAIAAFREWVQAQVVAPEGVSGKIRVGFVVGRNGGVQEVQIIKSDIPSLNEQVLNIVKSSPKWKPAKMDGSPLRTNVRITIEI